VAARQTEFLKGCTETMVLRLLAERAMYGYELMQEIRARAGGAFSLGQGTIYPLLYALERKGLVRGRDSVDAASGRTRRYYRLTPAGAERGVERAVAWRRLVEGVDRVLGDGHAAGA
jgi:DNA-binding PadR family transcriptional regulator